MMLLKIIKSDTLSKILEYKGRLFAAGKLMKLTNGTWLEFISCKEKASSNIKKSKFIKGSQSQHNSQVVRVD